MKLGRKIATMVLCMCMMVSCFSMMAHAATEGTLKLENATVEAGQEVSVALTGQVDAGIGKRTIKIKYDSTLLEFVSGTNTQKVSDGELQFEATEDINSLYNAKEFATLTFKALGNGTAKVSIASYDITSYYEINWTCHDSEVTISGGTATTPDEPVDEPVDTPEVDEPVDTPEVDEPVDTPENEGETSEDAEIVISNSTTITLISDVSSIVLPSRYQETTVMMNGTEYPAWQDTVNVDRYIIYAASSNGVKSLYQYDTLENTYQRFEVVEGTEGAGAGNWLSIFGDKANMVLLGVGALIVIFIILVIVLSVKLYYRNEELDEVYDDLDQALAQNEAAKKGQAVVTEDDVVLETEEEEDDSEVEVEFYVEESVKEFFEEEPVAVETEEEEDDSEVEVEFYVEEPVEEPAKEPVAEPESFDKTIRIPSVEEEMKKPSSKVEYYDDDEEFYDDLDDEFFVNFIDLDD